MDINNHIQDLLKKIGLTEAEARLYMAALKKPKSTLKELEKFAGTSTATVYRAFDKLKEMGLISSSQDNWRKNVEAVSLRSIGDKLAREQRKLRKAELELKTLNNLFDLSGRSFAEDPVEVITDKNEIFDKYFQILNMPWDKILAYGSAESLIDMIGSDTENKFVDIRCRKGKKADVMLTEFGRVAQQMMPLTEKVLRNIRIKPNPNARDFIEYIYNDELTIWNKNKDLGSRAIVIKDPVIVQMHKDQFYTKWNA
jgi:sugar-specific transcriptional regulator TrmB